MPQQDPLDAYLAEYDEERVEREIQRLEALREELTLVRRIKALRSGEAPGVRSVVAADAARAVERATRAVTRRSNPTPSASNGTARPETRRAAIEAVMSTDPRRPWKLSELRGELVERGWLGADDDDYHRLQVTASRMSQRKQLVRTRPGFYKLPPDHRSEEP